MMDEKQIALINKAMDGEISEDEQAEVEELLSKNEEARTYHDELQKLKSMFDEVAAVEPPADLKKNILNIIPTHKYQQTPQKGLFRSFFENFRFDFNFNYVYAFAFGLVSGIFIFTFSNNVIPPSTRDISGALIGENAMEKFSTLEQQKFKVAELTGTVELKWHQNVCLLAIELSSKTAVDLVVNFDGLLVRFLGFLPQKIEKMDLGVTENTVNLSHGGALRYALLFEVRNEPESLFELTILSAEGEVLFIKEYSSPEK